ncbi:MAG TPA: cellulase N-terminal Ig-like domain-containing protein, partial [Solirubrobacteraceae bacterium]|nr:cellulase N-terminal Ig-like domain-containing protein [Solirubrobacteraceae bacterium]
MGGRRGVIVGLAALSLLVSWQAPAAAAGSTKASSLVRVDQVGYTVTAGKRAYLMAHRDEAGAPFTVLDATSGATVYSGVVGSSTGSWSKRFGHVYALDFDSLQTPGKYTIAVGGRAPASSPPFAIAQAPALYERPLSGALSFYENERDGADFIPSALRTAAGHLNDAHASVYETPSVNR